MFLVPTVPILAQALPTEPSSRPPVPIVRPSPLPKKPLKPPTPPDTLLAPQETIPPQPSLPSQEVIRIQEIRPLPGKLDSVPVFNSNSPEVVMTEGILLSTFPPQGMRYPKAHLNYKFDGRFDIFSHHISRASNPSEIRSLFQGVLIYNPGPQPAVLTILEGASYLTRPDALFVDLPSYLEDPGGRVYAGPGSRVVNDILRGRRQGNLPPAAIVPPGEVRLLMNLPIPAGTVTPTSNGRSTIIRLKTTQPVYVANLAMFAPQAPDGTERVPTIEEWVTLLINSNLAGPRDIPPTPLDSRNTQITYGRVAGIATGSQWQAKLTDASNSQDLTIPKQGQAFSYGISLLPRGTFSTGQVQSATLLARYPDTAYLANGNYGVQYSLALPLYNNTRQAKSVAISLETPIKQDKSRNEVIFLVPPESRIFYRGPVRIKYQDDNGRPQTRFIHIVQRRGQEGKPLIVLNLSPGKRRSVEIDFLYPADATPPQLLTIKTVEANTKNALESSNKVAN